MPQARPRNKNASNKRQQNQSGGRNEPAGREGGKNASKFQQKGADARGQRGMQGARSQRANNQTNANNMPAHQRDRDEYGSVRGREFTESYESDSTQQQFRRGQEGRGGYDSQRESSGRGGNAGRGNQPQSRSGQSTQGRGNGARGQSQSTSRSSGYNYQEEDFEEGGQNESTGGRSARQNRGQSYQRSGSERGQQYDGDDFPQSGQYGGQHGRGGQYDGEARENRGGYRSQDGRNDQNRDGWGERDGRGQYQHEEQGDWERAGPGNYQGGEFQGGRSNRGRDAGYYGASQYSQGGGRGDYRDEGPNWNQRYGNVNRVPGGIEDEEFAESREYDNRGARRGRGQQGNGGGFENARGEYSNFNAGGPAQDEDSEMNDYTDARLGSNAKRGARPTGKRSKQGRITGSGRSAQSTSSTRRQQKSRSTGR